MSKENLEGIIHKGGGSSQFTGERREQIINMYEPCGYNAREAKRRLNDQGVILSSKTILNIWKSVGLKTKKPGGGYGLKTRIEDRLSTEEIAWIVKSYKRYNGNPNLAAKSGAHSYRVYIRIWEMHGLEINK